MYFNERVMILFKRVCGKFSVTYVIVHMDDNFTSLIMEPHGGYVLLYIYVYVYT